ncbi:DUF4232 domain-containing protein [Saccharopolyspora sp. NPDC002376]
MSKLFRRSVIGASLAVVAAGAVGFGASQAVANPSDLPPSACADGGFTGTITPADSTAGHTHYKVTLTANDGTSACTLAGSPADLVFFRGEAPLGVEVQPYGQPEDVAFGPGAPVHFDIQVPNSDGGAPGDRVTFQLPVHDGSVPGNGTAVGGIAVDAGTQVGPIRAGA